MVNVCGRLKYDRCDYTKMHSYPTNVGVCVCGCVCVFVFVTCVFEYAFVSVLSRCEECTLGVVLMTVYINAVAVEE